MSESQLRRLIDERSRVAPDAVFVEDARELRSISYRALEENVRRWGAELDRAGVAPGADVMIDVSAPVEFSLVFLAVIASGRCVVPVDPQAPDGERRRMRTSLRPAAVISDRDCADGAHLVTGAPTLGNATGGGALTLHTSGSTGSPKAVRLTEAQLLHVARQVAGHNQLGPGDRGYNSLPLFHINAEVVGLLSTLVAGATLVLDRKFQRRGFWELITERRITWINAVPALLAILARDGFPERPVRLRFIRSASAALPEAVRGAVVDAFGAVLVESYGMTEAGSQITATELSADPSPRGSVGRAIGVELQVRLDGGQAATGEVGRIWIRGDGVVSAYVGGRAPERFDAGGWLDTCDLGYLDQAGNLFHVGRADDVINRGGELVHPREIEEVLLADPRVLDAVVVGRPDEVLGEVPVAYLVTRGAGPQLVEDLTERCAAHLSRFKRPVELVQVPDLPRAATGKILRAEVARA